MAEDPQLDGERRELRIKKLECTGEESGKAKIMEQFSLQLDMGAGRIEGVMAVKDAAVVKEGGLDAHGRKQMDTIQQSFIVKMKTRADFQRVLRNKAKLKPFGFKIDEELTEEETAIRRRRERVFTGLKNHGFWVQFRGVEVYYARVKVKEGELNTDGRTKVDVGRWTPVVNYDRWQEEAGVTKEPGVGQGDNLGAAHAPADGRGGSEPEITPAEDDMRAGQQSQNVRAGSGA